MRALVFSVALVLTVILTAGLAAVGPDVLYRGKHIPGAIYAGPASQSDGLGLLKKAAAKLDRNHEIIVYCGCCPWDKCPNVNPL